MNPARVFYSEFWEKKKYEFSRTKKKTLTKIKDKMKEKTGRMIKKERKKKEPRGESQKKEEFQEEDIYEIECSSRLGI